MDFSQLLEGIQAHPYATLFAVSVVETRITAVCVGAFAAQGYINPVIAYGIFIFMNLLGDTLYYTFGRTGQVASRFLIK